jgi:hypothetical protein
MWQQLLPALRRMLPNDSVDIGLDKTAGNFKIAHTALRGNNAVWAIF